jgi:putative DNA primase/helicase
VDLRKPDAKVDVEEPATRRPVINYDEARSDLAQRDAMRCLVELGRPLYLRGDALTWLRDAPSKDWQGGPITVKQFMAMTDRNMRDELSALTEWRQSNVRTVKTVAPPISVCASMVELGWKFGVVPQVEGLFMAPTLRPDGSVLAAAGYDAPTRLLLVNLPEMPSFPERPTRAEAEAALALLRELLREFRFRYEPVDRAVALSLIVSAVVRGALAHVPIHLIKAPEKGSGKSYLVDLANVVVTGQRCAVVAARAETEKWERQIALALAGADAIVSLDNFNGELKSDLLAQAVTQQKVQVLLPYGRGMVEVECKSVLTANGNNIRIADDLGRRVVLCQLDPMMEKPWEREFEDSPLERIGRDRGRYVAAVLTIVRAYLAAEPIKLGPLNGFEDWSRFVREPLVWLGEVDPAVTQDLARSEDEAQQKKEAVFAAMEHCFGVGEANAKTCSEMLRDIGAMQLREALTWAVAPKQLTTDAVGIYLRSVNETVVRGLRLQNAKNRLGTAQWWVE